MARYLVELGIDSISLTPDRVLQTMQVVQEIEVDRRLTSIEQLGMHPIPGGSWLVQLKPPRGSARLLATEQ